MKREREAEETTPAVYTPTGKRHKGEEPLQLDEDGEAMLRGSGGYGLQGITVDVEDVAMRTPGKTTVRIYGKDDIDLSEYESYEPLKTAEVTRGTLKILMPSPPKAYTIVVTRGARCKRLTLTPVECMVNAKAASIDDGANLAKVFETKYGAKASSALKKEGLGSLINVLADNEPPAAKQATESTCQPVCLGLY